MRFPSPSLLCQPAPCDTLSRHNTPPPGRPPRGRCRMGLVKLGCTQPLAALLSGSCWRTQCQLSLQENPFPALLKATLLPAIDTAERMRGHHPHPLPDTPSFTLPRAPVRTHTDTHTSGHDLSPVSPLALDFNSFTTGVTVIESGVKTRSDSARKGWEPFLLPPQLLPLLA